MTATSTVEKSSNITRKLTITVPAEKLASKFEKELALAQRKANLKGFRPGHVPLQLVREHYGPDVRAQVLRNAVDESYYEAIQEHGLKPIGQPKIEPKDGSFAALEGQDLTYFATIEVLPEIQVKNYTGLSLKKEKSEVEDKEVDEMVKGLLDQHAEVISLTEERPVAQGDFVDFHFDGGLLQEDGSVSPQPGMKGTRMVEIGSHSLIPGFEDEMVGTKKGETKVFKIKLPDEYDDKNLAGKEAQFTISINEIKEKKLPTLDDDFAKEAGYESLLDLKTKAREALVKSKKQDVERKIRSDLLQAIIDKNPIDVPTALIQAQTRAIAQEFASDLKSRGMNEQTIQAIIAQELTALTQRAENQVRAGLILEAISKQEKITLSPDDVDEELKKMAEEAKMDIAKLREFYQTNPNRKESFEFRLLEDRTIRFLLDQAKIKEA